MVRLQGKVTFYDNEYCFGTIDPDDGGESNFFRASNVRFAGADHCLAGGEVVEFNISQPPTGRVEAVNITGPLRTGVQGTPSNRVLRGGPCCCNCSGRGHSDNSCPSGENGLFSAVKCYTCFGVGHTTRLCTSYGGGAPGSDGVVCDVCTGIGHSHGCPPAITGRDCKICYGVGHDFDSCPNRVILVQRGNGCTICNSVDHMRRHCTDFEKVRVMSAELSVAEARSRNYAAAVAAAKKAAENSGN